MIPRLTSFILLVLTFCFSVAPTTGQQSASLEAGWSNPPREARLRAYWWWLNGNVTAKAITRDLEEMKAKGFGGAIICDADGSGQDGNERVPHGPTFFSREWRALFKHAVREADRLGLELTLNIQSGWNLGGPMVTPDDAPKKLVWSVAHVSGPRNVTAKLQQPIARDNYYRNLFVLAYRLNPNLPKDAKPIKNLEQKALRRTLEPFSAPVSTPLFEEFPSVPDEEDTRAADVVDLTSKFGSDGVLHWDAPAGEWQILRIGCTLSDHCRVSTCSEGWDGYAIDPFDDSAFNRYWDAIVEPLIADAGSAAGRTLKYLFTDSWEVEVANWTPTLRPEFQKRRGYDLLQWLPVITGCIVNSREESDRFLHDFRRTMGDLAIDNHYKLFKQRAREHGLQIHPESGGPHAVPIDAQQCLGFCDAPMSEFWAWSPRHRVGDENRFFVKQPASAAHAYGHKLVLAEGFTTIGPHWQETLWDNLKPSFDHACTEGLNRLVWHAFVCSPAELGMPGQQYFAGTHLNPNVTWWKKSDAFFAYINRCQWMLQRGLPVADVAYYYGNNVPNFAQLRKSDPARVGPGYDYDVVTEEVILKRMSVRDHRLVLPDGMSYGLLVLPDRFEISLPVLRKLRDLVAAGATIVGPAPTTASGLSGYPQSDNEVRSIGNELWGQGRVVAGQTAREVLTAKTIRPDFEYTSDTQSAPEIDYIHRVDSGTEIYFVANRSASAAALSCAFRVIGKAPELWDPLTGEHHFAAAYESQQDRTSVPIDFPACGSCFVVFRHPAREHPATAKTNSAQFQTVAELGGPWSVSFDPKWCLPPVVTFSNLISWTERPEPAIKFYSGTATYRQTFNFGEGPTARVIPNLGRREVSRVERPALKDGSVWLDLGEVHELAEVKVNGKSCGVTWSPPFRVDISRALVNGPNQLEIEVINFWPNRIIGDSSLSEEERLTRTNIRKLGPQTALMPSGLLGPVKLVKRSAERTS